MSSPIIGFRIDDEATRLPLSQRIALSISEDVRRGRLAPGARLPGSRSLATSLGVHRNTVLAAFSELERQGYLVTEPGRGTFIAASLPEAPTPRARAAPRTLVELPVSEALPPERDSASMRPGVLPLVAGLPDARLVPHAALARAYRSALKDSSCLDYGDERGDPRLRAALSALLAETRGVRLDVDSLLVTRGSQMALFLAGKALARPGAVVGVEALGYRPAWEALRQAGLTLVPLPLDQHGLRVEALARLCQERDVAAVYLTPHHQYPTTVTLDAARRLALLRLAAARRFAIVEDDYDHEAQFEGRPVLPLASADDAGVVVYIGTLSKVLAPGLRVGYVAAQPRLLHAMRRHRIYVDRQGDHAVERSLAYFIEDGELDAHVRRTRREYAERREALMDALRRELPHELTFREAAGGLGLWARVHAEEGAARPAQLTEAWVAAALEAGVMVQSGRSCSFDDRPRAQLRLGFARLNVAELRHAVRLLQQSYPRRRCR